MASTPEKLSTRTLSKDDFATPSSDRYFEDYEVGAVYEYGYASVSEEEIIDFATRFDPQAIHTDPAFAKKGPFGGLIASGWHTGGIFMRLLVDHFVPKNEASLGSPGIDEMRWEVPVRPGDLLRLRTTILETRLSRSRPDRGLVRIRGELVNQQDGVPLNLVAMAFIGVRPTNA